MTHCPCCHAPVVVPSLDEVIADRGISRVGEYILRAVWAGRGHPVQTERIFDAMYVDDPNGGPSPTRMYAAFRLALTDLGERLQGSGVAVEPVGFREGWRLTLTAEAA